MEIYVLKRIHQRHPELTSDDVITAFRSLEIDASRGDGKWVCIGLDGRGRDVEIAYTQQGDDVVIYHAMTPPSKKMTNEIRRLRKQQR